MLAGLVLPPPHPQLVGWDIITQNNALCKSKLVLEDPDLFLKAHLWKRWVSKHQAITLGQTVLPRVLAGTTWVWGWMILCWALAALC